MSPLQPSVHMLEEFVFGKVKVLPHTQKSLILKLFLKINYILRKNRCFNSYMFNPAYLKSYVVIHISKHFSIVIEAESIKFVTPPK
jgi:hypothetical protein